MYHLYHLLREPETAIEVIVLIPVSICSNSLAVETCHLRQPRCGRLREDAQCQRSFEIGQAWKKAMEIYRAFFARAIGTYKKHKTFWGSMIIFSGERTYVQVAVIQVTPSFGNFGLVVFLQNIFL